MQVRLSINGRLVEVDRGISILEAAERNGINIPTLCYHKDLSVDGSCRLCIVDISGNPHAAAACSTEAKPGMEVRTETDSLVNERRTILKMLLAQRKF